MVDGEADDFSIQITITRFHCHIRAQKNPTQYITVEREVRKRHVHKQRKRKTERDRYRETVEDYKNMLNTTTHNVGVCVCVEGDRCSRFAALNPSQSIGVSSTVSFLCPLSVQSLITHPVCWVYHTHTQHTHTTGTLCTEMDNCHTQCHFFLSNSTEECSVNVENTRGC